MNNTASYFRMWELFHNPPGTPNDLACVKCDYIAGGILSTLGLASGYGAKRYLMNNAYVGSALGLGSLTLFIFSGVAIRLAIEEQKSNRIKIDAAKRKKRDKQSTN